MKINNCGNVIILSFLFTKIERHNDGKMEINGIINGLKFFIMPIFSKKIFRIGINPIIHNIKLK